MPVSDWVLVSVKSYHFTPLYSTICHPLAVLGKYFHRPFMQKNKATTIAFEQRPQRNKKLLSKHSFKAFSVFSSMNIALKFKYGTSFP
jgi:hypothetical protein